MADQVTIRECAAGGGVPTVSDRSSTSVVCDGGAHNGKEVIMGGRVIGAGFEINERELQKLIEAELRELEAKPPRGKL